jgi:hypothetical protein
MGFEAVNNGRRDPDAPCPKNRAVSAIGTAGFRRIGVERCKGDAVGSP